MRAPMYLLRLALCLMVTAAACRDPGRDKPEARPDSGPEVVEVTVCDDVLRPPDSGDACQVIPGTGNATLLRGDVLAPNTVFQHGQVLIVGDEIACVGCDCSGVTGASDATRIECANSAISAGLINPHDHLTFTEGSPINTGTQRYNHRHDWRGSLPTPSNAHGTGGTSAGMRWGELRMLFGGATSLVGSGAAEGLIRNLDRLSSAEEARGLRGVEFETFSLGDSNETFRADCTWNYSFEEEEVAREAAFLPHVAEGINTYAADEFFCQSRSTNGARDFTEGNTAHIHSIGLTGEDYFRMAADGAQIIWSPRSNIALYGMTAAVTTFDAFGGTIALGTDWTYSGSANMLRELACADLLNSTYYNGHFSSRQLHDMATINAAIATGNDDLLGSLEIGKLADISIFRGQPEQFHRAVIEAGNREVLLVIKGGMPLYGLTPLVGAFGASCDPVSVCDEPREVCTTREFSRTFAEIESEVKQGNAAYGAIFCDEIPAGEPTCVPSRPGEYAGLITGADSDGDGARDENDNCPLVFNPPRPIDGAQQPDADDDGIGDACDPEPLVADLDGDGIANADDNCPFDANAEQTDADSDNRGDTCDLCPALANPDTACSNSTPPMEVSIPDIRGGNVTDGTDVTVVGAVVTGIGGSLITVQDPSVASGELAGIQLFASSPPTLSVGDVVTVSGEVDTFVGNKQIASAVITPTGSGTPIAPVSVTAAQAASNTFQSVLVRVSLGTLVDPYNCMADEAACPDTGLWGYENGGSTVVAGDRFYTGADFQTFKGQLPIAGVTILRYGSTRIYPRTSADFN